MKNLFLIALCLMLYANTSMAQQAAAPNQPSDFSLADCINYAYTHQDSVKNAELDVKSAEYKIKETIGIGLPQVNGSVQFQDYFNTPVQRVSARAFNPKAPDSLISTSFQLKYNTTASIDASQILFDGTFLVGLKAVKTFKELSQRSLTRTKIQTNVSVTKAYYQVLVSNEQIKLLDANINQLKQQLDQTTQQNKQGFVEKIDVDRLAVQYNNLVTTRENVDRALTLNYAMLKFQMGMPIQQELTLTDKLESIKLDEQMAQNSTDTSFYHNRIEYNLLETNKRLSQLDELSKKAQFLPSLVAFGNLSTSFLDNRISTLYSVNFPYSFIGLKLNVPIFSGGQRINQLRQSQISVQKAQNDLDNVKNGLNLQATAARISFYNGVQSLNNQKRNRELAQEVLRVSKIKYEQGVGSSIEVTQAQTSLESADNQYIQALYDALVNKVNLDQAYGRIK